MLKYVYIKAVLLLIGFMVLAGTETAFAESSRAVNGGSAQVHVRFKIVIVPYISINTAEISTGSLAAGSNSSSNVPTKVSIGNTNPSLLKHPSVDKYTFAESPISEHPNALHNDRQNIILCSP